jgi:hypothetical protein
MDQIALYKKGGVTVNKGIRTALIVASSLMLAGALLVGAAFALGVGKETLDGEALRNAYHRLFGGYVSIGKTPGNYRDWKNAYNTGGEYAVPAEGIHSMDLRWIAGSVDIEVWDGTDIEFTESAARAIPQDEALRYGTEDGVLYIQYRSTDWDFAPSVFPEKRLKLRVPRSLADSLENLSFEGSSASLRADSLKANAMNLKGVSGEMQVSGSFETLDASSTSGSIRIENAGTAQSAQIGTEIGRASCRERV